MTDFDQAGAVWCEETDGQLGSPERLVEHQSVVLDDCLSMSRASPYLPDRCHVPVSCYCSFAYSGTQEAVASADDQLLLDSGRHSYGCLEFDA